MGLLSKMGPAGVSVTQCNLRKVIVFSRGPVLKFPEMPLKKYLTNKLENLLLCPVSSFIREQAVS